jgi:hypothetical protein
MKTLLNLFLTKIRWWTVFYFLLVLSVIAIVVSLIIEDPKYFVYSLSNFLILVLFLFGDIMIDEWRERRKGRMTVNRK